MIVRRRIDRAAAERWRTTSLLFQISKQDCEEPVVIVLTPTPKPSSARFRLNEGLLTSVFLLLHPAAVNGNMALRNGRFAWRNDAAGR
jgi:hypothetical protein